jgi:pSer/pThr/pTyr-binding forkhead associated (FHA) protein
MLQPMFSLVRERMKLSLEQFTAAHADPVLVFRLTSAQVEPEQTTNKEGIDEVTISLAGLRPRPRNQVFRQRYFELRPPRTAVAVGRHSSAQLVVSDVSLSRRHAEFALEPNGSIAVHDLQSTNGTFVNEQRLPEGGSTALSAGDVIRLGELVIVLHTPASLYEFLTNLLDSHHRPIAEQ